MNAQKATYNILSNASGVTDIVSTNIFPVLVPKGTAFPAICYTQIQTEMKNTKDSNSRLDFARVQIDCLATTYAQALEISGAVRNAMNITSAGTYNGVFVQSVFIEDEVHFFDNAADFDGIYQVSIDFSFSIGFNYGGIVSQFLLQENGDFLLLETGDKIIL